MKNFISQLLLARDVAHREHWKTTEFSAHVALSEFYDAIIEQTDGLVEAYQGSYDKLNNVEILGSTVENNIVNFLKKQVEYIDDNRYKFCAKDDTVIQNLIDEIQKTYFTALYKLRFLK